MSPKYLPLLFALLLDFSSTEVIAQSGKSGLKTLQKCMVGDFSSQEQSQRDSDYFDIRLHIRQIWASDKGNRWLYVEQAAASAENKPYRQRIYKLESDGKGFKSIIYTLPNQEKWAGAYKNPKVFDSLRPADLSLREGCTVYLYQVAPGVFEGATRGKGCESNLRGATYATSKAVVTQKALLSWDQGYNDKGEQVWGAQKGWYVFVKQ